MRSGAASVDAYLAELPPEKRDLVASLRALVLEHLPEGYVETMNWGMISYEVPLAVSGKTYNGKPLMYAAIGAQKHHVGLYLCGIYCVPAQREAFEEAHRAAGRKLDMGKACVRVKRMDDLLPEQVARAIAAMPPEAYAEAARH